MSGIAIRPAIWVNTGSEAVQEKGIYVPGTYTASAAGISSDVKVSVTVDEFSIVDVALDVSGETPGLGASIGDTMATAILEAQSSDVDMIAGSTITSNAVKKALESALANAAEGKDMSVDDIRGAAGTDDGKTDIYIPGTYSASSRGISSDVKVSVTVDETSITDVTLDVSGETPGIGTEIGETVAEQILAAQSSDIDGVTGATITSRAVKAALESALAEAVSE